MGYQIYRIGGGRWGGYGVPAYCEHPGCRKVIDRGMSYACGGEPFSEHGCDRYFCSAHRQYECQTAMWDEDHDCEENEDDCECAEFCARCAKNEEPFPYKREHPTWLRHLLKDESWGEWRKENPLDVARIKRQLAKKK